jgi:thiol-disulfide isomerase/thioredoxin
MGGRALLASLCIAVAVVCGVATLSPGAAASPTSAADFAYEDINPNSLTHGKTLALSDLYADGGLVLNFLASWCGFCWKELPELEKLQRSIPTPIVGVAADEHEGPEALLGLVKEARLTMPILLVPPADIKAMEKLYDHKTLPATYVIDKYGWVRAVFEGLTPMDKLEEAFAEHPTE